MLLGKTIAEMMVRASTITSRECDTMSAVIASEAKPIVTRTGIDEYRFAPPILRDRRSGLFTEFE
jgi:hypothetical protein